LGDAAFAVDELGHATIWGVAILNGVAFGIGGGDKLAGSIGDAGFFAAVGMEGGGGLSVSSGGGSAAGCRATGSGGGGDWFQVQPTQPGVNQNTTMCLVTGPML
jgi:hypothetical protein